MVVSDVSKRILDRRLELGLTQRQVADYVGVTEATVSRWESGHIINIRHNKIDKLARILQVSPLYIVGIDALPNADYPKPAFTSDQLEVLNVYNGLNDTGKKTLLSVLHALSNTYPQSMSSESVVLA